MCDMRKLEGDNADLAVWSPRGVSQVPGSNHPDGRVQAVVTAAVRRMPRPRVATQEVVGDGHRRHTVLGEWTLRWP